MKRYCRADGKLDAKGPVRFDPVFITHPLIIRRDEVNGFADVFSQIVQYSTSGEMGRGGMKDTRRHCSGAPPRPVPATAHVTYQEFFFL